MYVCAIRSASNVLVGQIFNEERAKATEWNRMPRCVCRWRVYVWYSMCSVHIYTHLPTHTYRPPASLGMPALLTDTQALQLVRIATLLDTPRTLGRSSAQGANEGADPNLPLTHPDAHPHALAFVVGLRRLCYVWAFVTQTCFAGLVAALFASDAYSRASGDISGVAVDLHGDTQGVFACSRMCVYERM